MDSIFIEKEKSFKDDYIQNNPVGNRIDIENIDLKSDRIMNIRPMLSSNSEMKNSFVPENRKVKIRPSLSKKVPSNTFSSIANQKKNISNSSDEEDSDEEDDDESEEESISQKSGSQTVHTESSSDEDESTIFSNTKNNMNKESHSDEEYEEDSDSDSDDNTIETDTSSTVKEKPKTYEQIQQEKQQLLFHLERLQKQGYPPSKKYSMASSYEDMQFEYDRLKKQRDVEKSIKFSRKVLMAVVSGVEFLNNRFDPFDIKLDGWSENMMENVSDYDEVFEELHDKYGESVKMAPELRLMTMVAGSGFMFHLTNSLFKSSSPKLNDILKQNPDIMKNVQEAAMKNMSQNISSNFTGEEDILGKMMNEGIKMRMSPSPNPVPNSNLNSNMNSFNIPKPSNNPMPMNNNSPANIDDLLNELNRDDVSVSSSGSVNIKSSGKRKNGRKGGIQLNF